MQKDLEMGNITEIEAVILKSNIMFQDRITIKFIKDAANVSPDKNEKNNVDNGDDDDDDNNDNDDNDDDAKDDCAEENLSNKY